MLTWRLSSSRMASSRVFSVSLRERERRQEGEEPGGTTRRRVEVGVFPGVTRRTPSDLGNRKIFIHTGSLIPLHTSRRLSEFCEIGQGHWVVE